MDIQSKINPLTVGIAIFVLILAGAGIWYWKSPASISSQSQIDQKIANISLGSQILKRTQGSIEDTLPETNPFSDTETNPLKRIIKNPF